MDKGVMVMWMPFLAGAALAVILGGCDETPEEKAVRSFEEWKDAHCASALANNTPECQRRALANDIARELRKAD